MANSVNVNFEQGIIENAVLYYTKIKTPSLKFGSQTEREYTVDVVVDKATAKAWNKQFPKQKAKELDNEEFLEKFKAEKVPFYGDEQFVIKMKKAAQYKDKTTGQLVPIPEQYIPRVFLSDGEGNYNVLGNVKSLAEAPKQAQQQEVTVGSTSDDDDDF